MRNIFNKSDILKLTFSLSVGAGCSPTKTTDNSATLFPDTLASTEYEIDIDRVNTLVTDVKDCYEAPNRPSRLLTAGERAKIYRIYKDAVDTSKITIHSCLNSYRINESSTAAATASQDGSIRFWGEIYFSDDYSNLKAMDIAHKTLGRDTAKYLSGVFFHEIKHQFDNQSDKKPRPCKERGEGYEYSLEKGKKIDDICEEQQASIFGDLSRRIDGFTSYRYKEAKVDGDSRKKDKLLIDTAAQLLPHLANIKTKRVRH